MYASAAAPDGDREADGLLEALFDGEALLEGDSDADGLIIGADGDTEGEREADGLTEALLDLDTEAEGEIDGEIEAEGLMLRETDRDTLTCSVGLTEAEGLND